MKQMLGLLQLSAQQPSYFSTGYGPTGPTSNRSLTFIFNLDGPPHGRRAKRLQPHHDPFLSRRRRVPSH